MGIFGFRAQSTDITPSAASSATAVNTAVSADTGKESREADPQHAATAVIFLGNPGPDYEYTRHNAGRLLAETFPGNYRNKFKGLFAPVPLTLNGGTKTPFFLIPETYMNRSGESAAALLSFYKIPPARCLVVHDEIELPLGTVALKWSGGLGGHNGLRSLKACLGTADFWRLRIGIGRPPHNNIADWVLSPFSPGEQAVLHDALAVSKDLLIQAVFGHAQEGKLSSCSVP
ncbi:MAG: aminoacyl-tRNA hydrolase [Spirochaetaceae bacterium]|jgi:PTH1 family peptidyl-tRNA hydrolase|nr:aminoacyl-tRNA hydrolase [Spirochaetaceae bacterium]